MRFNEQLVSLMKLKNITLSELAEKTGLSKGLISKYMRNIVNPKQVNILKIADALGVKPSFLMGFGEYNDSAKKESIIKKIEVMTDSQLSDVEKFIDTFILDKDTS